MKVKLLIGRSGPSGSFAPGSVIDVSEDEAKRLIDAAKAEPVAVRQKVQKTATTKVKETRGK